MEELIQEVLAAVGETDLKKVDPQLLSGLLVAAAILRLSGRVGDLRSALQDLIKATYRAR